MTQADTLVIPRLDLAHDALLTAGVVALGSLEGHLLERCNWPEQYPEHPRVEFRLGHTGEALWLRFDVREERIRAVASRPQQDVWRDSCVELFISFDKRHYYNLELSCIGIPLMAYGAERSARRDVPPERLALLQTVSTLGDQPFPERGGGFEWSLTARIPLECFAFDSFTTLAQRRAHANFYKCNSGVSVQHYLSWQPIDTPRPDFHRPESFGGVLFA